MTWHRFARADPDLAERVGRLFTTHRHHTMATLRSDGSPRISGTEVKIEDGEFVLGMMPGTRRAADLRRDARVAVHSQGVDPPDGDHGSWSGEAKVGGRAVEVPDGQEGVDEPEWFRIEIAEVVVTRLGVPADHLLIESWDPERGRRTRRR